MAGFRSFGFRPTRGNRRKIQKESLLWTVCALAFTRTHLNARVGKWYPASTDPNRLFCCIFSWRSDVDLGIYVRLRWLVVQRCGFITTPVMWGLVLVQRDNGISQRHSRRKYTLGKLQIQRCGACYSNGEQLIIYCLNVGPQDFRVATGTDYFPGQYALHCACRDSNMRYYGVYWVRKEAIIHQRDANHQLLVRFWDLTCISVLLRRSKDTSF